MISGIKGFTRTWLRQDCIGCFMNTRCINASAFGYDSRKYFLLKRGFRLRETEAMKKGKEMHAQFASEYPQPTIASIMKGLRKGKKIMLSEFAFCSRLYGFRGHPDLVQLQLIDGRMSITITDYKTSYFPTQMFQLVTYGLIFSDPDCEIIFEAEKEDTTSYGDVGLKKVDGNKDPLQSCLPSETPKMIGTRLYPREPFTMDIEVRLRIAKTNDEIERQFMVGSQLTEFARNYRFALLRRANSFRKMHQMGVYFVSELPYCRFCPQDSKKCSLWRICSKSLPDLPEKTTQRYFGRKHLLVKVRR